MDSGLSETLVQVLAIHIFQAQESWWLWLMLLAV